MTEIWYSMTVAILPALLKQDIPAQGHLYLYVHLLVEMQLKPPVKCVMTETLQIVMDVAQHVV